MGEIEGKIYTLPAMIVMIAMLSILLCTSVFAGAHEIFTNTNGCKTATWCNWGSSHGCGEVSYNHSWGSATCQEPKSCNDCGKTSGGLGSCAYKSGKESSHPHRPYQECKYCGKTIWYGEGYVSTCNTCNPPEIHKHGWKTNGWGSSHPHQRMYICACGETKSGDETTYISSCSTCKSSHTHSWTDGTCVYPPTCSCGETGALTAHSYRFICVEDAHPHSNRYVCTECITQKNEGSSTKSGCSQCTCELKFSTAGCRTHYWCTWGHAAHEYDRYNHNTLNGKCTICGVATGCEMSVATKGCKTHYWCSWSHAHHEYDIFNHTFVNSICTACGAPDTGNAGNVAGKLTLTITPIFEDGHRGEPSEDSVFLSRTINDPALNCVGFDVKAVVSGTKEPDPVTITVLDPGKGSVKIRPVMDIREGVYTITAKSKNGLMAELTANAATVAIGMHNIRYGVVAVMVRDIDGNTINPTRIAVEYDGGKSAVANSAVAAVNKLIAQYGNPLKSVHTLNGSAIVEGYSLDGKMPRKQYDLVDYETSQKTGVNSYAPWSQDTKIAFTQLKDRTITYSGMVTGKVTEYFYNSADSSEIKSPSSSHYTFATSELYGITATATDFSGYTFSKSVVTDLRGTSVENASASRSVTLSFGQPIGHVAWYYDKIPDPIVPPPVDPTDPTTPVEPTEPDAPNINVEETQKHYEYRVNTDVFSSFKVSNNTSKGMPAAKGTVATLTITGDGGFSKTMTMAVELPKSRSQLVWFKWKTPTTPQNMNLKLTINNGATVVTPAKTARVARLVVAIPPDPKATDKNKGFTPRAAANKSNTVATWGKWQFNGEWRWLSYSAAIDSSSAVSPDSKAQNVKIIAGKKYMKSGYGVSNKVKATISGTGIVDVTAAQNCVSVFPEFYYNTYGRILESTASNTFEFTVNKYSRFNSRVHFTPIWFPDGKEFKVQSYIFDIWTPTGMLYDSAASSVMIQGNVYDDWYVTGH